MYKEKNNKEKHPCTVTTLNEPNFELMAKAIRNLYHAIQKEKRKESGWESK